jgi:non-specific serine/threonine protein kinase/serine/threonine-protein kinase
VTPTDPTLPDPGATDDHGTETYVGTRIGPYAVVREIGRGGMGAVYLAVRDDDEYQKAVAIKLVKRGMDSDLVLRRFREERQILAHLEHPSIARLLDGGTTESGQPYLVMEYVEGLPIDRFCEARSLDVRGRLRIFRGVCEAVHHAHQALVVHCDLKPRNVLVTEKGEPKLLDFGIAKLLSTEEPGTLTVTRVRQMTPEYASPEQVRGEALTTSTDVYSLGVVLYELLTGRRPYRFEAYGVTELERLICLEDPRLPSEGLALPEEAPTRQNDADAGPARGGEAARRRRELRGDLDTIVMKAMRKEPSRRYASAAELGEDVRRHLEGLPVLARPDSVGYRAGKFVRRHKAGVVAAALVMLSLLAGILVAASQARIARAERAKALRRFGEVRQLAQSLLFEFHDSIQDLAGATPARELLVKRGLTYLDGLARESGDDPGLQAELAGAYQKVGDVQGRPGFANLGDREGALASYRKALALRESLPPGGPPERTRDLAVVHERIGDALLVGSDAAGARESYAEAVRLRESLAAAGQSDELRAELARGHQRMADALAATGDATGAAAAQAKALAVQIERGTKADATPAARRDLFIGYTKAGNRKMEAGEKEAALELYRQGLALATAIAAADPTNARARREAAVAHDKVGDALRATGDREGAFREYGTALDLREALSAADPRNAELVRDRSVSHSKLGDLLAEQNRLPEALASYRRSLATDEATLRAGPSNDQAQLDVAADLESIGRVRARQGAHADAVASFRRALGLWTAAADRDPTNTDVRRDLARLLVSLGESEAAVAGGGAGCAAAREHLAKARAAVSEMAKVRPLAGEDAALPVRIEAALRRCPAP